MKYRDAQQNLSDSFVMSELRTYTQAVKHCE